MKETRRGKRGEERGEKGEEGRKRKRGKRGKGKGKGRRERRFRKASIASSAPFLDFQKKHDFPLKRLNKNGLINMSLNKTRKPSKIFNRPKKS